MIFQIASLALVGHVSGAFSQRVEFKCSYRHYDDKPHCYLDSLESQILPVWLETLHWQATDVSSCVYSCYARNKSFTVAGVSGGDFPSCSCGTESSIVWPRTTSAGCNVPCPRSPNEICGGPGMLMSLYELDCTTIYEDPASLGLFDVLGLLMLLTAVTITAYFGIVMLIKKKKNESFETIPGSKQALDVVDLLKGGVGFIKSRGGPSAEESAPDAGAPAVRREIAAWGTGTLAGGLPQPDGHPDL